MGTRNQVNTGGHHGGGVDQRGDRGWTRHRVGKPGLQRQLCRFTHSTTQQHQGCPPQHIVAGFEVRRCQFHHLAEVQRAQLVVENEQREGEEDVTHAGHDERFHGRCAILRIGVVEPNQQVRAETHPFPAEIHQQQVIRQHQYHHAGDKQVGVGEEAGVTLFTAHIPGGEHMDQEADTGDHGEHGQREAIQHQIKTDVEITHRHPGPEWNAESLTSVIKEVDPRIRCDQCGQAHRAHADGRREILRPAAA